MEAADRERLLRVEALRYRLMIDISGDMVGDLPCVQQASYLEGGPLMWMLPLYLHVNQKSDDDDDNDDDGKCSKISYTKVSNKMA